MRFASRVVRVSEGAVNEDPTMNNDAGKKGWSCGRRATCLPELIGYVFAGFLLRRSAIVAADKSWLIHTSS